LRSRNGKPIEGYASIEKAMESFPPGYVYDGEIMSLSGKFSDMQAMAGRKGVEDKPGIFNIFDVVAIDEFFTGVSEELYFVRRIRLEEFFGAAEQSPVLALVDVIATGSTEREGKDPNEVRAQAEEMIMLTHRDLLAKGYEGSMLKDADGYYECKRSWGIQKVKDMDNLDLLVIGVEPGIPGTRLEGTMASIVVDYKGYAVNVGSGFSDELRAEIWKNKEDVINRIAEIKYFEESKDKKGNLSLRFPIFTQFRYDKE
jgi:DNA ligase-1